MLNVDHYFKAKLTVKISSNKDKNCLLIESKKHENICSQKLLERLDL